MPLLIELQAHPGGPWAPLSCLYPGDPAGSISSGNDGPLRSMYVFVCSPSGEFSTVRRSTGGIDMAVPGTAERVLLTEGLELLARLGDGQSYELAVQPDGFTEPVTVRFTHRAVTPNARTGGSSHDAGDDDGTERARRLIAWVREDTAFLSSPRQIANHVAYQALIAMGTAALPVLLAELRDRGGDWYIALRAILKAANVEGPDFSGGHPGSTRAVVALWVTWAQRAGYLDGDGEEAVTA